MPNKKHNLGLLDPTKRSVEPRSGQRGMVRMMGVPKSVNEKNRTMKFTCSTRYPDRYGEIVQPEAFRKWLPTFMENAILLAGHVSSRADGKPSTIGRWVELDITSEGLVGTAEFLDDRHLSEQLAEEYWLRYSKGFQRAVSVGFITYKWIMQDASTLLHVDPDLTGKVRVFTEVELVEISAVAIPANRQSLVRAASFAPEHPELAGVGPGVGADVLAAELLAVPGFVEALSRGLMGDGSGSGGGGFRGRSSGVPSDLMHGHDLEEDGLCGQAGFSPKDEYDFHDEDDVPESSAEYEGDDDTDDDEGVGVVDEITEELRKWAHPTAT